MTLCLHYLKRGANINASFPFLSNFRQEQNFSKTISFISPQWFILAYHFLVVLCNKGRLLRAYKFFLLFDLRMDLILLNNKLTGKAILPRHQNEEFIYFCWQRQPTLSHIFLLFNQRWEARLKQMRGCFRSIMKGMSLMTIITGPLIFLQFLFLRGVNSNKKIFSLHLFQNEVNQQQKQSDFQRIFLDYAIFKIGDDGLEKQCITAFPLSLTLFQSKHIIIKTNYQFCIISFQKCLPKVQTKLVIQYYCI